MNDSTIPDKVLYASMQDIYETMDSPVPVTSLELYPEDKKAAFVR